MPSNLIIEHVIEFCSCCWVSDISDEGCSLGEPHDPFACLETCKRFRANHEWPGRICDFVLFIERAPSQIVAPVEMKGNNANVDRAAEQLQGGADIAETVLGTFPAPECRPLLATKRALKPLAAKHLSTLRINFKGSSHSILPIRCGEDLGRVLV